MGKKNYDGSVCWEPADEYFDLVTKNIKNEEKKGMEIDNDVLEKLVCNLDKAKIEIGDLFDNFFDAVEDADCVEEVMWLKQKLLCDIVEKIPLGTGNCYFCILHNYSRFDINTDVCKKCNYGKIHGICSHEESDYYRIDIQRDLLEKVIKEQYFDDDKYTMKKMKRSKRFKKRKDCE